MSSEANKAVVRTYYGELDLERGAPAVIERFFAPDCRIRFSSVPGVLDRDG